MMNDFTTCKNPTVVKCPAQIHKLQWHFRRWFTSMKIDLHGISPRHLYLVMALF